MKIAMLQFDERVDDENIKAGTALNKVYCEMHGYDYIFKAITDEDMHHDLDDYLMDDKNAFKMNIYDYRIKMIGQYMNDYDYLIYLDTDAIVCNPNIKVEDLIDEKHGMYLFPDSTRFGMTYDIINIANIIVNRCRQTGTVLQNPFKDLQELKLNEASIYEYICRFATNPETLASGIIIVNCHWDKLKEFINDFNRFYPLFDNSLCDQGCINVLLRRKKYKDALKIMQPCLHGNPFLNKMHVPGNEDYEYDENKTFICHFYSNSGKKNECKKYIEEIKNNKWWNNK